MHGLGRTIWEARIGAVGSCYSAMLSVGRPLLGMLSCAKLCYAVLSCAKLWAVQPVSAYAAHKTR